MDEEIIEFFKKIKPTHAIIIVLFKGRKLPRYCTPMPRIPKPRVNILIKHNLAEIYSSAIKKNLSLRDGAILIQVNRNGKVLRGFSYRLYPLPVKIKRLKNKGSAYNSAMDFSKVKRVICVYFIDKCGISKFTNGKEKKLL